MNTLVVPCTYCHVPAGTVDVTASGKPTTPHAARKAAAALYEAGAASRQVEVDNLVAKGIVDKADALKTGAASRQAEVDGLLAQRNTARQALDQANAALAAEQAARATDRQVAAQLVVDLRARVATLEAYKAAHPDTPPVVTPPPVVIPPPTTDVVVFPAADFIRKPIPDEPRLDPMSAEWAKVLSAGKHVLNGIEFGCPIYEIPRGGTAPSYNIAPTKAAAWGYKGFGCRIPDGAKASPGSDGAFVVIDWDRNVVTGFWQAKKVGTGSSAWVCSTADQKPIDGDGRTGGINTGVVGAGISRALGVITAADWERAKVTGDFGHALVFSTNAAARDVFRDPARKTDGANNAGVANPIPEGARIQLNPALDCSRLEPVSRWTAQTLQRYGAINIDNGGATVAIIASGLAPAAGFTVDYQGLEGIDWSQVRVLAAWDGT